MDDHDKKLLELGRKVESIYKMGYISKKQAMLFSFLQGLMSGFGAIIGGTVIIALVLWLLTLFHQIPLLGPVAENIKHTLQSRVK